MCIRDRPPGRPPRCEHATCNANTQCDSGPPSQGERGRSRKQASAWPLERRRQRSERHWRPCQLERSPLGPKEAWREPQRPAGRA
eukprot:10778508-Alexandrium_andersonii.AAC.1